MFFKFRGSEQGGQPCPNLAILLPTVRVNQTLNLATLATLFGCRQGRGLLPTEMNKVANDFTSWGGVMRPLTPPPPCDLTVALDASFGGHDGCGRVRRLRNGKTWRQPSSVAGAGATG